MWWANGCVLEAGVRLTKAAPPHPTCSLALFKEDFLGPTQLNSPLRGLSCPAPSHAEAAGEGWCSGTLESALLLTSCVVEASHCSVLFPFLIYKLIHNEVVGRVT